MCVRCVAGRSPLNPSRRQCLRLAGEEQSVIRTRLGKLIVVPTSRAWVEADLPEAGSFTEDSNYYSAVGPGVAVTSMQRTGCAGVGPGSCVVLVCVFTSMPTSTPTPCSRVKSIDMHSCAVGMQSRAVDIQSRAVDVQSLAVDMLSFEAVRDVFIVGVPLVTLWPPRCFGLVRSSV